MARGGIKKPVKRGQSSNPSPSTGSDQNRANISAVHAPPSPFKPALPALLPFVETLPTDHVFIVHIESTPAATRKQTFLVPVLLNLLIMAGLCWRVYYALPAYLEQMITILGYDTRWTVNPKAMAWTDLGEILFYRTFLLSMDYVIFGLGGRWPVEFVFGDKYGRYVGPLGWKWDVGFSRKQEPIVRRGRKWDLPIYDKQAMRKQQGKPEKSWTKEEELLVHTKCFDALQKNLTSKNALTLLDKDWDLDYHAMVDATELLDAAEISTGAIDHVVLVPWQGKWYYWYPHGTQVGAEPKAAEKDEKLEAFKKRLMEINCEDIFYRWIEIVQYETSQPMGFTVEKKKAAENELRRMLRSRSKDDEAFVDSVGGLDAVPGMT